MSVCKNIHLGRDGRSKSLQNPGLFKTPIFKAPTLQKPKGEVDSQTKRSLGSVFVCSALQGQAEFRDTLAYL